MDEFVTRYFKSDTCVMCMMRHSLGDGAVATTNAHVLSDPADVTSAPADGWVEIPEGEFNVSKSMAATKAVQLANQADEDASKARHEAYNEAVQLGFSPKAASTMSGYTPTGD